MERIYLFDDEEFQDLDLDTKHAVLNNYFDTELVDDEFRALDAETQAAVRASFADAQLDSSMRDTASKVIDYLTPGGSPAGGDNVPEPTTTPPSMPPAQSDTGGTVGSILFGSGEEYENPDAEDYELGKRLINRTNELTSNAIQATYAFLGNLKTPAEYLGISTKAQEDMNEKREAWFKDAADNLNDFVYEKNRLDVKPTHTWEETKKAFEAGGVFSVDSWQELLNYGGSEMVVSAPDMAEMVAALPLYFSSRLQESAESRALNDGRQSPTGEDYMAVAPTTMGSIMLDRFGLKSTTKDVVERVGKEALEGGLKEVTRTIAKEVGKGALVEGTTEAVQNPLEMFGEEVGTQRGVSDLSVYADVTLAGLAAGGVMGAGMSGTTSTGAEVFKSYTKAQQDARREQFISDAYARELQDPGEVVAPVADGQEAFEADLEAKIIDVQRKFENLLINHPEMEIPGEAVDDIVLQSAVVAKAEADGMDVGNADGLNAVDSGFRDLSAEMVQPDGGMVPRGVEQTKQAYPVPETAVEDAAGVIADEQGPAVDNSAVVPAAQEEAAVAENDPAVDPVASDRSSGVAMATPLTSPEKLGEFVKQAMDGQGNTVASIKVSQPQPVFVETLKSGFDLDISGATRRLSSPAVNNILKAHGDPTAEAKRGQIAVTEADIVKYEDITTNFDEFAYSPATKRGRESIIYRKTYGDVVYHVEEVKSGKETLVPTKMWKVDAATPDASGYDWQPAPRSNAQDVLPLSKDTIPEIERRKIIGQVAGKAKSNLSDGSIRAQEETSTYASKNGYDEAGANYVPCYSISGIPARPAGGTITVGDRVIDLPTLDAPINADTVRVYLSDIIGPRLYEAKIKNKSTLGIYRRNDSAIRVKNYSDVEVMAHEMAHFLDFFYSNKTKTPKGSWFRSQMLKHRNEIKALSYTTDKSKAMAEGFAEFVRLWLTNYNTLTPLAPGMIKDFESRLKQDKALNEKMLRLQEGMHQYYYQGEHAMLRGKRGGELNPTAKKIRRTQEEIAKDVRQQVIDKLHSIKRIEAAVRGDVAADAIDSPYKMLQLVNGHSSVLYSAMNIGVPTVTAEGDMTYSGKPLNEIFAPATSVGEERVRLLEDYMVARRASELMVQGRENLITAEEITVGLELGTTYPEFVTIFEEYQDFNDAMLDFYVDMNLITSGQRAAFQEANKNYVPFHRIVESVQYGEVPASSIGKRLTGGTHSLGDIMENIINGLDTNIREAMVARGKSVFYDMLEKSGMGGVYATKVGQESRLVKADVEQQAKKIAQMMVQLGIAVGKDGMVMSGDMMGESVYDVSEIETNLIANPEALEFWTHGHKPTSLSGYIDSAIIGDQVVYFEVNDPGIVDAITSFRGAQYNGFVRGLMVIKNIMTWNITNNPLFYLTNFMRDTVSGAVLSKNNFLPVISSMSGMYHFVTKSKTYKAFMASGAGYGTRRTSLGKEIDAMTLLDVNRGFEVLTRVASALEYTADIFEYGTRVGEFALAREAGKSNMQAAFEGREVSTDFAIKGSNPGVTGFMATVPFMKAAINGLDKTARRIFSLNGEMKVSNAVKFRNQLGELQTQKIKIYATGGILASLSLWLWLQNRDDERYKKLTRDQKMLYWNFFIDGRHIKIPKPYDIGFAFASLPELMANGIYEEQGEEAAKDFLWGMKTMFSIGDVSGMFQPVLEQMTNENWMGSPIVPYHMQNVDDLSDQYLSTTPLLYRKLGDATGASPIMMQHYVDGYLGLTAKMLEETTENLLWNKKEWGERPFAKDSMEFMTYRFTGKEVEPRTRYSEKYYELMERAAAVRASYDRKRKEAAVNNGEEVTEYVDDEEKQAYLQIDGMMRKYNKILTNVKMKIEMVTYDKGLTRAEKEAQINEAYTAKTQIFKTVTENLEAELEKLEGK